MSRLPDVTGKRFGRLVALRRVENNKDRQPVYECICDCGATVYATRARLCNGATRSCGCLKSDTARAMGYHSRKHGMAVGKTIRVRKNPTYQAWVLMRQRCYNSNRPGYARYGGRGIYVCERWQTFENFLADMGERPANPPGITGRYWSLDRYPNGDGNYEPGNCRWATSREQNLNKRETQRSESARKAANARWTKENKE